MASSYQNGKTWTVSYKGELDGKPKGSRSFLYGIRSESLARRSAAAKTNEEQLLKAGLVRPEHNIAKVRAAELQPIEELIVSFEKGMKAKGRNRQHIQQTVSHIRRLLKAANVMAIPQLEAEPVQAAARAMIDEQKLAPRTANAALKAVGQFSRWLSQTSRTRFDVLHDRLHGFNEAEDVRRQRRALSAEEIAWLLGVTPTVKDSGRPCGIKPADRAYLYAVGLGTGFRQRGLLSLTKASFHVDKNLTRPFVRLGAKDNKTGMNIAQPIRRDLAESLREWLATKPEGKVWQKNPHADLSHSFQRDMKAARAAWIAAGETPQQKAEREKSTFCRYVYHDGARNVFADFHGLRHTGITLVVRHAGLRVGQAWAGHSTPVLTAKYAHLDLVDEDKALDALPATSSRHERLGNRLALKGSNLRRRKHG